MKAFAVTLLLLSQIAITQTANAQATCLGEAQIIAKVSDIKLTMLNCTVKIDPASVSFFNDSMVCPLDIDAVLAEGVEVGIKDGHDCALNRGDTLSGIIVRSAATGKIYLE